MRGGARHKGVDAQLLPGHEADDHDEKRQGKDDQDALLATSELDLLTLLALDAILGLGGVALGGAHERARGISLDALGIAQGEEHRDQVGGDEEHDAEADDDGLVDLYAHVGEGRARDARRKGVDRRAKAADAGTQEDHHRTGEGVIAGSHHRRCQKGIETHGLLAKAVGGAEDGEEEHQDGDEDELVATQPLDQHLDARVQRIGLVDDAEKTAEDGHEEADVDGIDEAFRGSHQKVAECRARDDLLYTIQDVGLAIEDDRYDRHHRKKNEDDGK